MSQSICVTRSSAPAYAVDANIPRALECQVLKAQRARPPSPQTLPNESLMHCETQQEAPAPPPTPSGQAALTNPTPQFSIEPLQLPTASRAKAQVYADATLRASCMAPPQTPSPYTPSLSPVQMFPPSPPPLPPPLPLMGPLFQRPQPPPSSTPPIATLVQVTIPSSPPSSDHRTQDDQPAPSLSGLPAPLPIAAQCQRGLESLQTVMPSTRLPSAPTIDSDSCTQRHIPQHPEPLLLSFGEGACQMMGPPLPQQAQPDLGSISGVPEAFLWAVNVLGPPRPCLTMHMQQLVPGKDSLREPPGSPPALHPLNVPPRGTSLHSLPGRTPPSSPDASDTCNQRPWHRPSRVSPPAQTSAGAAAPPTPAPLSAEPASPGILGIAGVGSRCIPNIATVSEGLDRAPAAQPQPQGIDSASKNALPLP